MMMQGLSSTPDYSPTIFDDYEETEETIAAFYISGLENVEVQEGALSNLLEKLRQSSPKQLQSLLTAFCIELHAHTLFKKQFMNAPAFIKSIEACPHFLEKAAGISAGECEKLSFEDGFNKFFKSSEGIAFYFRFLGSPDRGRRIKRYSSEEVKALQLGASSENHEISSVANFLLGVQFEIEVRDKFIDVVSANNFIRYINLKLNEKSIVPLADNLKKFKHFVVLFNDINKHKEGTRILMQENPSKATVFRNLQKEMESLLEHQGLLEEWEKELAEQRPKQFEFIHTCLLRLRDQQKGKKIEFTRSFLKHELDILPVQIESYLKIVQEKFPRSIPDQSPPKKPRTTSKARIKPKPKPQKRTRIAQKAASSERARETDSRTARHEKEKPLPVTLKPGLALKTEQNPGRKEPAIEDSISRSAPKVEFKYAPRVMDWFRAEPMQLNGRTYRGLSESEKFKQKCKHAFPLEVEGYIPDYGFEKVHINEKRGYHPDRLICIPGEMRFYLLGETVIERGVYNFCMGEGDTGEEVYHRHFTRRPDDEIFECAKNAFYNFDYPSLEKSGQAHSKHKISSSSSHIENMRVDTFVDPITQAVTFSLFNETDIKIVDFVLFKTG
jgi:hypothetical protein